SSGNQTYTGAVTLGAGTTLTTTGNSVDFVSTVTGNSHSLAIGVSGSDLTSVTFGGAVSGLTTLNDYGTSAINGGSIASSGNQTYTGAVTLGAGTTLTTTGNTVDFVSTVTGNSHSLAIGVSGSDLTSATFGGAVSGLTTLNDYGTTDINTT